MRSLGIDSDTWTASVGVIDDQGVLAERSLAASDSQAGSLLPIVDETLTAAGLSLGELDVVAVAIGPGSFTGLRIGLSVAKGLAIGTGTPVVGVPTLEALAWVAGPRSGRIYPVMDARKGELYAAAYYRSGDDLECVEPGIAIDPVQWAARLTPPCTLIGDGVDAYAPVWRERMSAGVELVPCSVVPPRGAAVAHRGATRMRARGADDVERLEPIYLRSPQPQP